MSECYSRLLNDSFASFFYPCSLHAPFEANFAARACARFAAFCRSDQARNVLGRRRGAKNTQRHYSMFVDCGLVHLIHSLAPLDFSVHASCHLSACTQLATMNAIAPCAALWLKSFKTSDQCGAAAVRDPGGLGKIGGAFASA